MYRADFTDSAVPLSNPFLSSVGAKRLDFSRSYGIFSLAFPVNAGQEERKPAQPVAMNGE
jgi:hypothetical protein